VQRLLFGPLKEPYLDHHDGAVVRDLGLREIVALVPLVFFIVWIGVQPKFFLDRMGPSVDMAISATERSFEERFHQQERTAKVEAQQDGSI